MLERAHEKLKQAHGKLERAHYAVTQKLLDKPARTSTVLAQTSMLTSGL